MHILENKTFDEIKPGDSAQIDYTLNPQDLRLFAELSSGATPVHFDEAYIKSPLFTKSIGAGMWGSSLILTVIGTLLPGPGTKVLQEDITYCGPIELGNTLTASVTVTGKTEASRRVTLATQCANQRGECVVRGTVVVEAPAEKIRRKVTHAAAFSPASHSPVNKPADLNQKLVERAKGLQPLITAVIHPVDAFSLAGAVAAAEAGLIIPLLVGPENKIREVAEQENLDISSFTLVPTPHSHAAADLAVQLAREAKVEALMKGKIHTDEMMHPILDKASGLRTGRRMSHVFMVEVPSYPKPLLLTDAAINIRPTLMDKKDIVQNAVDLFHGLGMGTPKVAILSAVETVNEKLPSTLDATALCKMAERGQITGAFLDGPLAFDNAVSEEAAAVKGIYSQVAGKADILVTPDIESGNMLYKQLRFLSGCNGAGVVLGAQVPIILTSRAGDSFSRVGSCALALLWARDHRKERAA